MAEFVDADKRSACVVALEQDVRVWLSKNQKDATFNECAFALDGEIQVEVLIAGYDLVASLRFVVGKWQLMTKYGWQQATIRQIGKQIDES